MATFAPADWRCVCGGLLGSVGIEQQINPNLVDSNRHNTTKTSTYGLELVDMIIVTKLTMIMRYKLIIIGDKIDGSYQMVVDNYIIF